VRLRLWTLECWVFGLLDLGGAERLSWPGFCSWEANRRCTADLTSLVGGCFLRSEQPLCVSVGCSGRSHVAESLSLVGGGRRYPRGWCSARARQAPPPAARPARAVSEPWGGRVVHGVRGLFGYSLDGVDGPFLAMRVPLVVVL